MTLVKTDGADAKWHPHPPGSHLVDAIVAVSLFGGVLADAPPLGAAHHPHWLPRPPVLGLCSEFVVERRVTVESQRSAEGRDEERKGGNTRGRGRGYGRWDQSRIARCGMMSCDRLLLPVHVCQSLVEGVLSNPLVSREVATPAASVGELVPSVLEQIQIKHLVQTIKHNMEKNQTNTTDSETHHFILEAASQHQRIGAVVAAAVDPAHVWPVNARLAHLNSEFPGGSNRNTRNGPIMIGRDDGAFLSSPHTGHTLQLQP